MTTRFLKEMMATMVWTGLHVLAAIGCYSFAPDVMGTGASAKVPAESPKPDGLVVRLPDVVQQLPQQMPVETPYVRLPDAPPPKPIEAPDVRTTEAVSTSIEPTPQPIESMTAEQVERFARRYKSSMDSQGSIVVMQVPASTQARDLGNTIVIKDSHDRTRAFDANGIEVMPRGQLAIEISKEDRSIDWRRIAVVNSGYQDLRQLSCMVIAKPQLELELYRSLYRHLQLGGQSEPSPDRIYEARLTTLRPLSIHWRDFQRSAMSIQ